MRMDNNRTRRRDMQFAAFAASAAIVTFFLVYWFIQIQDTREMLKMAYG